MNDSRLPLAHLNLTVADVERSIAFYRQWFTAPPRTYPDGTVFIGNDDGFAHAAGLCVFSPAIGISAVCRDRVWTGCRETERSPGKATFRRRLGESLALTSLCGDRTAPRAGCWRLGGRSSSARAAPTSALVSSESPEVRMSRSHRWWLRPWLGRLCGQSGRGPRARGLARVRWRPVPRGSLW
jgi:catechol 2,3-dioxygenase-like lactoylglutathione lyase family enzyme